MFSSRSRRTTRRTSPAVGHSHSTRTTTHTHNHHSGRRGLFSRGPTRAGRVGGLKAAVNNPNVTSHGRKEAQHELRAMGVRPPKERISTRLRRMLGIGGRRKNRAARY